MNATVAAASDLDRSLAGYEALSRELASRPGGVPALREGALRRFGELGFPTTRQEAWRFTNVAPITRTPFCLDGIEAGAEPGELQPFHYDGCWTLVVVNGRVSEELSDLEGLPDGVRLGSLAGAMGSQSTGIEAHLGRYASFAEQPFVALNTALFRDGVYLHVAAGVIVERPLHLVLLGRPDDEPPALFPRLLLIAGRASQVTVIEQYGSLGGGAYLHAPVTEVVLGPGAVMDHYKLQRESTDAFHLATLQVQMERDSTFSSHSISWGGALVRNDVNAVLDGEGVVATLNGLYMVEGRQHIDNHMKVEHARPHGDSHELYKGILEGQARAVFNGLIHVHPGAQKTDAKQSNRNLLLSRQAVCNSNPQLEIFADDVKCTHGSTVGQIDEEAIFYLRSRGIGEEAARSLLTYAFASDIVDRIKVPQVRRELEEFLFRRLPKGDIVRQAV